MAAQNGFDALEIARRRSVKIGDIPPGGTTVLQLFVPLAAARVVLPPNLPGVLWQRDRWLSITPRADAQWGCAVGVGVTKVASLAWDIKSDIRLRSKQAQQLCLHADSALGQGGWVHYIAKQVRDYLCTNNGCVTEIVREKLAYGSKIVGINHLPSVRCRRTGDPEVPFLYLDKMGAEHKLRWYQVMYFSDLPDPDEQTYGGGLCAAERAYPQIIKMAAIENYVYEKVSASRPLAIHIVSGMRTEQIEDAIKNAEDQQVQEGFVSYMGAVIMATIKPDSTPGLVTINLAELPDGFDPGTERSRADLIYANAVGLDLQDLVPLSNSSMGGTGQQSRVLHEKGKGKGLFMFRTAFVHGLNNLVFDNKTKFIFTERDYEDALRKANVATRRAATAKQRIDAGITSPEEERALMVESDELPTTLARPGTASGSIVADSDKPDVDQPEPLEESYRPEAKPEQLPGKPQAGAAALLPGKTQAQASGGKSPVPSSAGSGGQAVAAMKERYQEKSHVIRERLRSGDFDLSAWRVSMEDTLSVYTLASYLYGTEKGHWEDLDEDGLAEAITVLDYAHGFLDDATDGMMAMSTIGADLVSVIDDIAPALLDMLDTAYARGRERYAS